MDAVITPILLPFISTTLSGQSHAYSSSFFMFSFSFALLAHALAGVATNLRTLRVYSFALCSVLSPKATRLFEWATLVVVLNSTGMSKRSDMSYAARMKSRHS